jgi:hypothetical protein
MPAAFTETEQLADQSKGPNSSHTGNGSRFIDLDSRGSIRLGATVTEAIAEAKRGSFTVDELKQLAFAMGYQIIGGKDTAALSAQVTDLQSKLANAEHRAQMAEGAFMGKNDIGPDSIAAIVVKAGFVPKADYDAAIKRAESAESALATATQPHQ